MMQTDGNKIVIKGERKRDPQELSSTILIQQRQFGAFTLEVTLPLSADISKTEQTYSFGVLTVKVPLKQQTWRTLDILTLAT